MSTQSIINEYAVALADNIDNHAILAMLQESVARLDSIINPVENINFEEEVYSMASMLIDSMELCGCRDDKICDGCTNMICEALYADYADNQVAKGLN